MELPFELRKYHKTDTKGRWKIQGMICTEEEFESGTLPQILLKQQQKLYGLIIAPDRLRQIRKERRALGKYSSAQQVRFELRETEKIFRRYGIPNVDTTKFSIEEISSRILDSTGVERRVRP